MKYVNDPNLVYMLLCVTCTVEIMQQDTPQDIGTSEQSSKESEVRIVEY